MKFYFLLTNTDKGCSLALNDHYFILKLRPISNLLIGVHDDRCLLDQLLQDRYLSTQPVKKKKIVIIINIICL